MTKAELKKVLDLHIKWLNEKEGGERADLRRANLSGAALSMEKLRWADLRSANLSGADLSGADLRNANLSCAVLSGADLSCAVLSGADLSGADLSGADLSCADIRWANLSSANLSEANLSCADIRWADIRRAIHNENTAFFALQCPEEGSFIGYKKASGKIVKLLIPEDAKRSSATSRKCRCSKATVLSITNLDGSETDEKAVKSDKGNGFIYRVGKAVEIKDFDENRWNECSTGIHFFITREEAVQYQ